MSVSHHWLRPTAALLLCVLPAGAAQDPDLADKLFHSGERAYVAKSYKEALDTWGQLLQSAPASDFAPQVLLRLAQHQIEVEKKPEAAFPYLDRLKADYIASPWAAEGLLLRGTLLARQARRSSDLKDAIAEFNRVLDLFPEHPACAEARFELGRAWRDQGQWGRALQNFVESYRSRPDSSIAPQALLEAAETLDLMGDLPGCLNLLQRLRSTLPSSPLAQEAAWRLSTRVKHRLQKPPFRMESPWPAGKVKWLKTPILLATAGDGGLVIFQNDLDRAFRLKEGQLIQVGPVAPGTKTLLTTPAGALWMVSRNGLVREDGSTSMPLGTLAAITGARQDRWGTLWVSDSKTPALTLFPADGGSPRTVPSPTAVALAPLPSGGAVIAADADRTLHFLDAEGQPKVIVPYGKDLPAPFRYVVALASDPLGHVAALVDGGEFGEGVVLFGPDGALLRHVTFKALGLAGRITSLALDRDGGVILCDRRNDMLIRLN